MSPGPSRSPPKASVAAFTENDSDPRWMGRNSPCETIWPSGSNTAHE